MPDEIKGLKLYEPGDNARENELRRYLKGKWNDKYNY
jgi:putative ATPase